MHKILKAISDNFHYGNFSKKYYGRIGSMINRYGSEIILECIEELNGFEDNNLTHLLNVIEKRCQKKIIKTSQAPDFDSI